eukprot:352797-Prymnesium_polylepis.1
MGAKETHNFAPAAFLACATLVQPAASSAAMRRILVRVNGQAPDCGVLRWTIGHHLIAGRG